MGSPIVRSRIFRDTYRDSVELMRAATELERLAGVRRAALLIATPANRQVLEEAGLLDEVAAAARPSDLIVAVAADDEPSADQALARADALLRSQSDTTNGPVARAVPATIAAAVGEGQTANLALISTPGPYATAEALKALKRGLHVFLFSDNVSVDDEVELKRLALRKGLLVMGPDCGTAILDGVPLGFANAVRRGRIGVVGASGTGLQHVVCLIDRFGEGISQAIGTGGRDLDERVGGLMMLAGLERLAADPGTTVIVLVSKPPSPVVARRILDRARAADHPSKPVIVCFLGGDAATIRAAGATPAGTLEIAALLAVERAGGRRTMAESSRSDGERDVAAALRAEAARLLPSQRAIRGLFSGGTLAYEAALLVKEAFPDPAARRPHTILDLGDDEYTVGRPHPMIDFRLRNERIVAAAEDPETAVVLLDVVLGYGSHPDPAGALAPALAEAHARAQRAGRTLIIVGSVCGAAGDPQGLAGQEARLAAAGVLLAPSNARAARLALSVVRDHASAGPTVGP